MVISCSYCYLCHVEKKTLNRKAGKKENLNKRNRKIL